MPIPLGIFATAGAGAGAAGPSFDLISTTTIGTTGDTVTFSSIPQTYKHLQIRATGRSNGGGTNPNYRIRFNGDSTATAYHSHWIFLNGSNDGQVYASSQASQAQITLFYQLIGTSGTADAFAPAIIDILDYASTTKNTTVKSLGGGSAGTTAATNIFSVASGMWQNTSAVNSINLFTSGTGFVAGSRLSLYGIKG